MNRMFLKFSLSCIHKGTKICHKSAIKILSQVPLQHFKPHPTKFLPRFPYTICPLYISNHPKFLPSPIVSSSVEGATISRQKKSTVHSQFANKFACHALPVFQKKRSGRSEWSEQDSNKTGTRPRTEKCGNVATSNSENAVPNIKKVLLAICFRGS